MNQLYLRFKFSVSYATIRRRPLNHRSHEEGSMRKRVFVCLFVFCFPLFFISITDTLLQQRDELNLPKEKRPRSYLRRVRYEERLRRLIYIIALLCAICLDSFFRSLCIYTRYWSRRAELNETYSKLAASSDANGRNS